MKALPREFWHDVAQMHGNRLTDEPPAAAPVGGPTPEEVRAIRLARFAPEDKKGGAREDAYFDAIWTELGF